MKRAPLRHGASRNASYFTRGEAGIIAGSIALSDSHTIIATPAQKYNSRLLA